MARIIGGITTSHIPAIGAAISAKRCDDPYWKPFFDAYPIARQWLDTMRPDVAILVYNDHGLNFFLNQMPTFAFGAAEEYHNADEGWGLAPRGPYPGDPALSWHVIEQVMAENFDLTTCQEMLVDHGFTVPMSLLWQDKTPCPVRVIPVAVNTVQHPLASPRRCFQLGQAIGRAVASYPENVRVVVLGTGGLSHQLDGERAGFINRSFDRYCMDKIVNEPEALLDLSIHDLIEQAGSQGVEFIQWLLMRGALSPQVRLVHQNYHIPISNTGSGLMVLESAA